MGDGTFNIHFTCQRCLQPLKLDASFHNMNEHTIAELSLPVFSAPDINFELNSSELDHIIPPFKASDAGAGGNGFTLLGGDTSDLNNQTRIAANLLNIVSGHSAVDHPLCEECADSLLDLMDQELKLTVEECHHYQKFFVKKFEVLGNDGELDTLTKELEKLKEEEERLMNELASLQEEEKATEGDIAVGEEEKERLDQEEQRYWREYSRQRSELMLTDDLHRSLECQLSYAQSQLAKLKKTNVFNATFHIWHSGHFGTINNFRLGRLPSAPVDWSEINAAWGQTVLLLTALARKMNLTFEKFRLVPYGNHSYIEVLAEHRELPLYGSGGFRFLWDTKFDAAMVAFLECLQQFKEEVEKGDSGFCLPYRMDKGKIEDSATGNSYSVKIQFNSEEQWTKALKFLLTNLKWGLAWVTSQFAKDQGWMTNES